MKHGRIIAAFFAVLMVTGGAVAQTGNTDRVSPLASDAVGWTGYDLPDGQVYHDVNGEPLPGVFVHVDSADSMDSLKQWANASNQRRVIQRYNSTNTVLIAAPMNNVKRTLTSADRYLPGGDKTISSLGYVTGWDLNIRVGNVDPVQGLSTNQSFNSPSGAWAAKVLSSGDWSADGYAWDSDANETHISEIHADVGANTAYNGTGVDVAVLDTGVNFGNGSRYGNGTTGSDFRVTDGYDFVDGEKVNLSVQRSEMESELEKLADGNGHGSWVSSATLNAKSGIAPDANLMAYRVLNDEGQGSTGDIKAAIARANRQGADILVMSLGSPTFSDAMAQELRYALSEDGNVTAAFVAVGNSYPLRVSSPADVDTVIGVQATNAANASTAKKAYFGNIGPDNGFDGSGSGELNTRGNTPDTAAPGMKIATPVFDRPDSLSPTNRTLSGTSMATPIAAGVGAQVLEAKPGLEDEPDRFHDLIVNSGAHTPHLGVTESEGGMVNATRAINGWDTDAPDRNLTTSAESRDAGNDFLAGDLGVKLATIGDYATGILG